MAPELTRPPIVPKLKNPPPRPDREKHQPMVINFKSKDKKAPRFAIRFLFSLLIVSSVFFAIAGFSLLCTYHGVLGIGVLIGLAILGIAFAASCDDSHWS